MYYKLSQVLVIYSKKRKLPSKKHYALLIAGLLILGFGAGITILGAVNNYTDERAYEGIISQEFDNISIIKEAVEKCSSLGSKRIDCYIGIARNIDNIELCRGPLPRPWYSFNEVYCVDRIILEKGDPELCEKYYPFPDRKHKHVDCITDIAEINTDPEICRLHNEAEYKKQKLNYENIMETCIKKASSS